MKQTVVLISTIHGDLANTVLEISWVDLHEPTHLAAQPPNPDRKGLTIKTYANWNSTDPIDGSMTKQLIDAAKEGWVEELQALLSTDLPINCIDGDCRSALFWAIHGGITGGQTELAGHLDCAEYLIAVCPPSQLTSLLEFQDRAGRTALFAAAAEGREQVVTVCSTAILPFSNTGLETSFGFPRECEPP